MHGIRTVLIDLLAACVLVFAASLARLALDPFVEDRHPFAVYYCAIIAAVLWRGLRTAVLVTVLGGVVGVLFAQRAFWAGEHPAVTLMRSALPYALVAAAILVIAGRFRALTGKAMRAQERYRTLVELSPEAVVVSNARGEVLFANQMMAQKLGVPAAEELIGRSLVALIPEEEQAVLLGRTLRTLRTGETNPPHLFHVRRPDGQVLIAEVTSKRVRWDSNWAVMSVSRDITDRVEVEAKAQRLHTMLRALMDSSVLGVLIGQGEKLQIGNQEMLRILGRTNEDLARGDVTWPLITPLDQMDIHEEAMRDLREHGRTLRPREKDVLRPDGSRIPLLLGGALVDRGTWEWICFALDRTEQQRYERQLLEVNDDLRHFADAVGHDLREPLRGMSNFANFLIEDHGEELSGEAREKVETIRTLADRLSELIEDLLAYAKAGRGEVNLEPVDPGEIASVAIDSLRDMLRRHNAEVTVASMPGVKADATLLAVVLQNLIANAVKYNASGAPRVDVGWENGHLFVRDNGIGIHERHHQRIFEPFRRLHGRSQFGGGSGIGLAIVKRIVERHGGRIWVRSRLGEGTTFCIELPPAHPAEPLRHIGRETPGREPPACPDPSQHFEPAPAQVHVPRRADLQRRREA